MTESRSKLCDFMRKKKYPQCHRACNARVKLTRMAGSQNAQLGAEVSFLSVRAMVKHHFQQVGHVPGSDGVVTHSSCRTHHFLHQLNLKIITKITIIINILFE